MATMLLPEDPADTSVSFALPKKLAPYLRELYDEIKREGETLEQFICRKMCERGTEYVLQQKIADRKQADAVALTVDITDMSNERTALHA